MQDHHHSHRFKVCFKRVNNNHVNIKGTIYISRAAKFLASLNFIESSIPLKGLLPEYTDAHVIISEFPNIFAPFYFNIVYRLVK